MISLSSEEQFGFVCVCARARRNQEYLKGKVIIIDEFFLTKQTTNWIDKQSVPKGKKSRVHQSIVKLCALSGEFVTTVYKHKSFIYWKVTTVRRRATSRGGKFRRVCCQRA